jgi:hypothetical protein
VAGLSASSCLYDGGNGIDYPRWPWIPGATPNFQGNPSGGTKLPACAAFAPLTGTLADGTPTSTFVWGLGNAVGKPSFQTPSADLIDPLFEPIGTTDANGRPGIGLHPYSWGWVSSNRYQFSQVQKQLGLPLSCSQ